MDPFMREPNRQINEIRGTVLGDGTCRLQTGEFAQANHRSADELIKFFEAAMGANPQRQKARGVRQKHAPKVQIQTNAE